MTVENQDNVSHVAVLVLDTPIPNITEKYGDFGDNTKDLLSKHTTTKIKKYYLAYSTSPEEYLTQLQSTYKELEAGIKQGYITGLVLTGSRSDAFGEEPWIKLLDEFIVNVIIPSKVQTAGICFGHQILCKNLGAKIGRNEIGWEAGTTPIEVNPELKKNSPFSGLSKFNMVEFHQDIVYELPPGCVSIGSTDKCNIQGVLSPNLLTFQGHPEFTTELALDLLKYKFEHGLLTKQEYEHYKSQTVTFPNQGTEIGEIIAKFLNKN
ncbi:uncharacterized protein SPAPADRAFT_49980 [Spathaspora passalidarum NRRL Y-27907]|uniref:Glutamine amidotransferase domain-containing protein n=1 Tax=Spathaspora passalidarum (strain NRRL Y-27907 / 11-Y1) TaxID=619300 RepID=G3AL12_SPAPN|nr:uncharacterized protein SPAPADRAFT_49980 [Spathaspora passalidarum NRRL Y-27907]EGW33056.1 hypothetical protein SPAPADRAFT_49980 [Spathaspora passalidarum NRRL Y-27907]